MALAIAATVLAFTVLQDWISPAIPGTASGFRYVALGFQHSTGDNFSSLAANQLPAILSKLPSNLRLGLTFSTAERKSRGLAPELDSLQWGSFPPLWTIRLMEMERNTHHVYRLMYHFVWIPKYRHKVLSEPC